ncbi:MAG: small-conductance mechanosensitive channel [Cognaticolwellia sp.]|jgi:small-conductance mechanosensitive channel
MWPLIQAALAQSEATPPSAEPEVPLEATPELVAPEEAEQALKTAETSPGLPVTEAPVDAPPEIPSSLDQILPTVPTSTADPSPIFQTSENLFEDTTRIVQEAAALPDSPEMFVAGQSTLGQLLELHLFTIGSVELTPGRLLLTALTLVLTFAISRLIRRATTRAFNMRGVTDAGRIGVTNRLVHYTVLLLGFSLSLEAMGIHLSALFAAGAIFAVGLGFAMQNIVQNFVSGVILLIERSIKPTDVLKIDGELVRVEQMGIRATVVRTRDEEEIIVPNGVLVGSAVKNYTKGDRDYRVRAPVGVHYKSDMDQVEKALLRAAKAMPGPTHLKKPVALLLDFGDNSVNWEVSVWTRDPWAVLVIRSQLNKHIWNTFKKEGIEIAFPQLDVHLDKAVLDALRGAPRDTPRSKK